jgi:plastocyanin
MDTTALETVPRGSDPLTSLIGMIIISQDPVIGKAMYVSRIIVPLMAPVLVSAALPAHADPQTVTLSIKEHRFDPETLEVPAGQKIKLVVKNLDSTPEEIDSRDLKVEKVIPGNSEATINVGPLKPGTYKFVGEFHEKTAKGQIVAR